MNAAALAALWRATARRYRHCDRFTRYYVACKLRMDPVHAAVLRLGALGHVVDVGSGRGQLAVALLLAGTADSVVALDQDAHALSQLRLAAQGLSLRTETRDLAADPSGQDCDTVLLIDVLYQLPASAQVSLLAAAACARRSIIIRTADPAGAWRSAVAARLERLGRGIWPTFGERVNPLPIPQLAGLLERYGLVVEVTPCAQGTPFANVLVVARRG